MKWIDSVSYCNYFFVVLLYLLRAGVFAPFYLDWVSSVIIFCNIRQKDPQESRGTDYNLLKMRRKIKAISFRCRFRKSLCKIFSFFMEFILWNVESNKVSDADSDGPLWCLDNVWYIYIFKNIWKYWMWGGWQGAIVKLHLRIRQV